MQKGSISVGLGLTLGLIATASVGFAGWSAMRIGDLQNGKGEVEQRITRNETEVENIEEDIHEIKGDVKSILRALNVE